MYAALVAPALAVDAGPPAGSGHSAPVALSQAQGTLRDGLRLVSDQSKVQHRTAPPFDDRWLIALNADRSLSEVRRGLAATYSLTWRPSPSPPRHYLLEAAKEDLAARQKAALAMRQLAVGKLRQRWEQVRRMAFMTDGDLRILQAQGETKARTLQRPSLRSATRLAFSLPPPVLEELWSQGRVDYPPSQLAPQLQTYARTAFKGDRSDLTGAEILSGTIRLAIGGSAARPTVWMTLRAGQDGRDVNLLYAEGWTRQPPQERRREAQSRPTPVPKDPRFRTKVTLREPASRAGLQPGERPPGAKPLGALLKELSEQVDLPLLAEVEHRLPKDDPDGRWLRKQWWLAADLVKRPLPEVLDMLCADFECEWRFEHGFLLIRPRLWFLEPEEREYVFPK
jgi:hypothetical protein